MKNYARKFRPASYDSGERLGGHGWGQRGRAGMGLLVILLLILYGSEGCKSSKNTASSPSAKPDASVARIVESVERSRLDYETLKVRGRGHFRSESENRSFSYRFHVRKDSMLWGALSVFGITGVQMLLTPDSMFVKNLMERTYYVTPLARLRETLGLEWSMPELQRLLLGELPDTRAGLKAGNAQELELLQEMVEGLITYHLEARRFRIRKVVAQMPADTVRMHLDDYQGDPWLPYHLTLTTSSPSLQKLELNHASIEVNPESLSFRLNIPKSYDRQY